MSAGDAERSLPKVALVGHPNVGKTTLFNQLTGARKKVGNYPGVTVEKVSATLFTPHGHELELVDLPGAYALTPNSPDETVTRDVLFGDFDGESRPDLVICVVDASSLERHLYLALQVMDLGIPVVLALNQVDRAAELGIRLNRQILADLLEIPVISCQATTGKGVVQLKQAMRFPMPPPPIRKWKASGIVESQIAHLTKELRELEVQRAEVHAIHLLADSAYRVDPQPHLPRKAQIAAREAAAVCIKKGMAPEDAIQKERFLTIRRACRAATHEAGHHRESLSDKLDQYVLHPVWGWFIFAAIMFGIFWSIFRFASIPMDFVENLVAAAQNLVATPMPDGDLEDLLVEGIIGGVGSVLIFLPQIALLFLFIGLLEGSGYMSRAAFLMDKVMGRAGLTGKSFLPLLSGYACAIPGVMATRTINSAKERILTILILPWMSCSARLPVYLLLIPLLVTGTFAQTMMMFLMYALGTGMALVAAWLLGKRIGKAEPPPHFLIELPPYRWPDFGYVGRHVLDRAMAFLKKAGTVILGLSILLWALAAFPKAPSGSEAEQFSHSFMGRIGKVVAPVVAPLGWDGRLGTAMLTSFAAREVFVSSMAISYAIDEEEEGDDEAVRRKVREKITAAKRPDGSRLYTPLVIFSLLVFYIYALQCLPTTVVVHRETQSWRWALGQLAGMTAFAYVAAFLVFQIGRILGFT